MPMVNNPKGGHPIPEYIVKEALREYGDGEGIDDETLRLLHHELKTLTDHIGLEYFRDWIRSGRIRYYEDVEIVYECDPGFAFLLRKDFLDYDWDDLFLEVGIDDPVRQSVIIHTHKLCAEALVERRNNSDRELTVAERHASAEIGDSGYMTVVMTRSELWREAEQTIIDDIEWLQRHNCSPAETLDFLMCELRGRSQTEWANAYRGKDQSAISHNVAYAREKVTPHPDAPSGPPDEIMEELKEEWAKEDQAYREAQNNGE